MLQPPFFDPSADDAVNYGAIGAIIGHEISHGFDDQGSQFDGTGNLRVLVDRRGPRSASRPRPGSLVAQYSAFSPFAGYHVNGELTLGENIADNSGLEIAYKAYQRSLARQAGAGDRRHERRRSASSTASRRRCAARRARRCC